MISVIRKTHIPSAAASCCCSASSNWWAVAIAAALAPEVGRAALLSDNFGLLPGIGVSLLGHDGGLLEVVGRRRRGGLPFEPGGAPRIRWGEAAVAHRPDQVHHRDQVADPEDRRARARHD